jgi:hypothetical protein
MPLSRQIRFLATVAFAFVSFASISLARAQRDSATSGQKQIVRAVNAVFGAVRADVPRVSMESRLNGHK